MLIKAEIGGLEGGGKKEPQASNSAQDCKNAHISMDSGSGGMRVAADSVNSTNEEPSTGNIEVETLRGNDGAKCGGLGSTEDESNAERFPGEGTSKSKKEDGVENEEEGMEKKVQNSIPVVQRCQGASEPEPENTQQDVQPSVESAVVAVFGPSETTLGSEMSYQETLATTADVGKESEECTKNNDNEQMVEKEEVDDLQYGANEWLKEKAVIESQKQSGKNEGHHNLEVVLEFGRHPKMDRVQEALYMSLVHRYERLKEELRYAEEAKQRAQNHRSEVGMELYGLQQVVRLKSLVEEANDSFSSLEAKQKESETIEEQKKEAFLRLKTKHNDLARELNSSQENVGVVQETLHQVKAYNASMRSKIEVTKRKANKAEEVVQGLEKKKGRQDAHIEMSSRRVQFRSEEVTGLQEELNSYQGHIEDSDRTIRETTAEMEAIDLEKKQLLMQWQSALLGLTRRDEALTSAMKSLTEAEGAVRDYESEVASIKMDVTKAQKKNEFVVEMRDKVKCELKVVNDELHKTTFEQKRVAEEFSILKRSLEHTESEEKIAKSKESALIQKIDRLQLTLQAVVQERQKLEAEAALSISNEETVSQAVQKNKKKTNEMLKALHAEEIEAAKQGNELARTQVEVMDIELQNLPLTSTKNDLDNDIVQKEDVIKKYQQEIQQKKSEIEKKLSTVQGLNHKYDKRMEQQEDPEHLGPWEATINNLQKEISRGRIEVEQMKQSWMRDQTRLVSVSAKIESLTEQLVEQKAKTAILQRREQRLLHDISVNEAESRCLQGNVSRMHVDSGRLKNLIKKNGNQAEVLTKSNTLMKKEFSLELRELEHMSVEIEAKIKHAKEAKLTIMEEIVEEERKAMLLDKKIKLNKALNETLNPEMGRGEVKEKEKEIHSLELCLKSAMREQENLIKEMEQAILKREAISIRQRGISALSPSHGGRGGALHSSTKTSGSIELSSRRSLKLSIKQKRKNIEKNELELLQVQRDVVSKQEELANQKYEVEMLELNCKLKGTEHKSLQDKLFKLVNEKKRFDMEIKPHDVGVKMTEKMVEEDTTNALSGIKDVIHKLEEEFPDNKVRKQIAFMAKDNTSNRSSNAVATAELNS